MKDFKANTIQMVAMRQALVDRGLYKLPESARIDDELPFNATFSGSHFSIFGDRGYFTAQARASPVLQTSGKSLFSYADVSKWVRERLNSKLMSGLRVTNEWAFGILNSMWPSLCSGDLQLGNQEVSMMLYVGILLMNVSNCYRPNQIAQYFAVTPMNAEEYLALI